jgi:hypothetical protein
MNPWRKSLNRHCERSEAIQCLCFETHQGKAKVAGCATRVKRLLRRYSPVRRYSRRPFELVRRMRRSPPVLTIAMTRFMAREHFPAGKGVSQAGDHGRSLADEPVSGDFIRAHSFVRLLQQAHDRRPLTEDYLAELQSATISNPYDSEVHTAFDCRVGRAPSVRVLWYLPAAGWRSDRGKKLSHRPVGRL